MKIKENKIGEEQRLKHQNLNVRYACQGNSKPELNIDLNQGVIFVLSHNSMHNRRGLMQTILVDLNIIMITMKIKSSFFLCQLERDSAVVVRAKFS